MATPPSITSWHRLVPISRSSDFDTAIAAEIHDPLWMLARQHQIGELRAQDAGSPTFVRLGYKAAPLVDLVLSSSATHSVTVPLDPTKPIEAQILPEPHAPDLATRVELGLILFQILDEAFGARAPAIRGKFSTVATLQLPPPQSTPFDPIDGSTSAFALMTVGRALDGVAAYQLAKAGTIPTEVSGILVGTESVTLLAVYGAFVQWVEAALGQIGTDDPQGWNPSLLDYDVQMRFGGANTVTLNVEPNENGAVDWTSFDLKATVADPFPALPVTVAREVPMTVRFPGMPAPRYWDFESGKLPWPDVDATRAELSRLLVIDFAMLYGLDWFVVPLELDVSNAVKIDSLVVYDVFGGRTVVDPVEAGRSLPTPDRFTMYSTAAPSGNVAGFMVLAPGAGTAMQQGPVLEEVRFARDEMANMVWGIEAVTASRIGERRRGNERDAAVDAATPALPPPPPTDAPLRYQIESKIPVNWIPFLLPETGGAPSTVLDEGATLRSDGTTLVPVPAAGKILNPVGVTSYQVFQEQIPRSGARVQRLTLGSRARDGKSYLWVARRRRAGTGETQSGLRFDAPLPTQT
jgi:hypothetical protein